MTRLSEALKRAAENAGTSPVVATADDAAPAAAWQFAPVETMHVPVEPASAPADAEALRRGRPASPSTPPEPEAPRRDQPAVGPIRVGAEDRDKLIIGEGVDPALVEQYRHLAAVMHHAQKATGVRSVMVTSALPSEGKTLTATNLALTLSESYQRRVLLIDADLRRPRLKEMFALPAGPGLTDSLLAPGASLPTPTSSRLPVHQVTPTLWVLAAGKQLHDPMSALISPAMKQLLDDARDTFDWVVVDTPPIAILPDANLLAAMIDTALLVVSAQSTPYPMVQRAAQAIGTSRILGVVLNRAEKTGMPANYGYYGYQRAGRPAPKRGWLRWFGKSGGAPSAAAPPAENGHVQ